MLSSAATIALLILASDTFVTSVNAVCTIKVPANPLTPRGLATPFEVTGCNQISEIESSFVQGVILNPATGQLSVYNPLIINAGTKPAAAPVVPKLPAGAIVGLWFGNNGRGIRLIGPGVKQGNCVSGLGPSSFGRFAACNAIQFFNVANRRAIVPPLGLDRTGRPCPSVRDFSMVNQAESSSVITRYILTKELKLAQDTPFNRQKFGLRFLKNGFDSSIINEVQAAIGCKNFLVPDLATEGRAMISAFALNELQANRFQKSPVALVPINHPLTRVNGIPNIAKTNLFRQIVGQPATATANDNALAYCKNILAVAPARLLAMKPFLSTTASPNPKSGNSLYTFAMRRLFATLNNPNLNCLAILKIRNPIVLTLNTNGVAVDAKFSFN